MEYLILNILLWFALYTIVALSLNMEFGYAGIPNFGKALAVLIGAMAVGGIVNRILMYSYGIVGGVIEGSGQVKYLTNQAIADNPVLGLSILIGSLLLSAILGGLVGALFILPSAKLSEDYLAITLLAISEVVFMISYYNVDLIGGYYGVSTPDVLAFIPGESRLLAFTVIALIIAFSIFLFMEKILNSPFGRVLRSMRENETVSEAFGKNVMKLRIKTVALGSSIAALAGALYSLYSVNVITTSFSRVEWTFYPILMILLGGAGNNAGVTLGVFAFVTARIMLITFKFEITSALGLPFEAVWLEYILFGIVMLLILVYRPEGLLREKPIHTKPIRIATRTRNQKIHDSEAFLGRSNTSIIKKRY